MAVMPDELIPKKLMDQVLGEITAPEYEGLTDTAFGVTIQLSDKSFREKTNGLVTLTDAHRYIAREALWLLNKDVGEDGTWIWVWYAPVPITRQPRHAILGWKDRDGDLIASVEVGDPIARHYAGQPPNYGGIAAQVLARVREWKRDLEIKDSQTRKAAQGEPSAAKNPAKAVPPDSPIA